MTIKTGILGATGYTGAELLRLLCSHRQAKIKWITSEKFAGKNISDVFPGFRNIINLVCRPIKEISEFEDVDLVFSCLPHGSSMHFVKHFLYKGTRLIDLSPDFRFKDHMAYNSIYKTKHAYPELLKNSVYGLPELFRNDIKKTMLTANPGCFATSVILGLYPLIGKDIINSHSITIDSKAGLSGGGRAPALDRQFSESNDSISVSSISGHNQKDESVEIINEIFRRKIGLTFSSYQVNIKRGILTTITSKLRKKMSKTDLLDIYSDYYKNEPFIRIFENESSVSTKNARYTNYCDIGLNIQGSSITCVTTLDNLGKGASGQAVQNMNIMYEIEETESLLNSSIFP